MIAAMAGALSLLLLLIMTTVILRGFSNDTLAYVSTRELQAGIQPHDNGHEGQIGRLPIVAGTPLRGSGSLRSSERGDGRAASSGCLRTSEDPGGRPFSRLREEPRPHP